MNRVLYSWPFVSQKKSKSKKDSGTLPSMAEYINVKKMQTIIQELYLEESFNPKEKDYVQGFI